MDSTKKGASAKQANTWIIDGLQPDEFCQAVRAHDTRTLEDTCELISDDITEFEGVIRVLGITQLKGVIKAANTTTVATSRGSMPDGTARKSRFPCGNCGGDHDKKTCQHRDECIPC